MNKDKIYNNLKDYKGHVKIQYSHDSKIQEEILFLERFDKNKNPILKTNFNKRVELTDTMINISKHNLLKKFNLE